MEIRIFNETWIEVEKVGNKFMLIADGDNGNRIVIEEIDLKRMEQLKKDISKFIKG